MSLFSSFIDSLRKSSEQSVEYHPRLEKMGTPLSYGRSINKQAAQMVAPQLLTQAQDSARLVNETVKPDVFFDRYDFLIGTLTRMAELERFGVFSGTPPHITLREVRCMEKRTKSVNDFVDRYLEAAQSKLDSLKTQAAQVRNLEKIEKALDEYRMLMPPESLDRFQQGMDRLHLRFRAEPAKEIAVSSGVNERPALEASEAMTRQRGNAQMLSPGTWKITVTFGKSRSEAFSRALFLAQSAPEYEEVDYEGKTTYCASFGAAPAQYLAFVRLYELVQNWKTTAVMINGQLVDRKIIGGLNYCYGDRCRTGRGDFCFGASMFTENPFGCHRLQISEYNTPWYSFAKKEGFWYRLDKAELRERIDTYATAYRLCPAFDYDKILQMLDKLPDRMTEAQMQKLRQQKYIGL